MDSCVVDNEGSLEEGLNVDGSEDKENCLVVE